MDAHVPVIDIWTNMLDDERFWLEAVQEHLLSKGIKNLRLFQDPKEFLEKLDHRTHILLIDYSLGVALNGLDIMKKALEINPNCFPIIMTTMSNPDLIIDFYDAGAFGYVRKDKIDFRQKLVTYIEKATEKINTGFEYFNQLQASYQSTKLLFKTYTNVSDDAPRRIDNISS